MRLTCKAICKDASKLYLKLFFQVILLYFCVVAFATEDAGLVEKLAPLVGTEASVELAKNSKLFYMNYSGVEGGKLFKFNSKLLSRTEKSLPLVNPIFTLETLSLVKKTDPNNQKSLANILCSISTLKGLQYYSPSRKRMRLLYKDSYIVRKEEVKGKVKYVKMDDPVKLFDGMSCLVFQEDLTFGKNVYEAKYFLDDGGVSLVFFNAEPLYYSIFKALDAKDLNSMLIAYDVGEYLLLYTSTRAKFKKIIGLENKVKNSFMARLDAMEKWFIAMYNE